MMRLLLCGPAVLAVLGCESSSRSPKKPPSAGPGATTLEELRERALSALRAGDDGAYLDLVATPAFLLKHCPASKFGDLAEGGAVAARDQQQYAVRSALAGCLEAFDWSRASLDRVEGGAPKQASSLSCDPPSEEHEDLTSFFRVGDATWRVKVANDVYRIAGRYVVLDVPTCQRRDR